jgi:alkylation response protein AidB-like acyl-CoA dehydrogenase
MNFGFTEEQDFLRDAVRKFVDGRCPIPEVRKLMESENAHSEALWKEMAELGWLGLLTPEEHGGAGLSWVDFVVLLEETGRTLLPSPLVSNTLAGTAIREAGSPEQQARWLPALADGSTIGTLAFLEASDVPGPEGVELKATVDGDEHVLAGEKTFVADVGAADVFVIAYRTGNRKGAKTRDTPESGLALALVARTAQGVSVEASPSLDETKRSGTLRLEDVRISPGDRLEARPPAETLAFLQDCGAVAVTAEAIGAAEGALALTVQYAKDHVQFGSPIGRYQGVKHRLSDQWVDTESIKSLLYYAAWAIDNDRDALPRHASLAKAYVADAFTRIGVESVQLHGAVGYTLEYDVQLYLKRSKWVRSMFGDADYHRDRLVPRP